MNSTRLPHFYKNVLRLKLVSLFKTNSPKIHLSLLKFFHFDMMKRLSEIGIQIRNSHIIYSHVKEDMRPQRKRCEIIDSVSYLTPRS